MQFKGVHHVSINVRDLEQALRFYRNVLGLELLPRPNSSSRGAWLKVGDQQLHLIERPGHRAPEGQHFAFHTEDIDAAIAALERRDVQVTAAKEVLGVCRQCFFRDPSGNLLELNEPA